MDDFQILDLYWQRSQQTISETSAKYGPYCYSIAYNILSNHEDAEESVNDTYLAAWNAIPPQRPSLFSAFLGKITRHLSLDRWRSLHRQKRGSGFGVARWCIPPLFPLYRHRRGTDRTHRAGSLHRRVGPCPRRAGRLCHFRSRSPGPAGFLPPSGADHAPLLRLASVLNFKKLPAAALPETAAGSFLFLC